MLAAAVNRDVSIADPAPAGCTCGIDPGLQRTGYAIVAVGPHGRGVRVLEAGVIRLPRERSMIERLVLLSTDLGTLLDAHRPAVLACEALYAHYKHPRTAILMAHARGVIIELAARRGVQVLSVAATHVKKLLTGSGRASKRQIQLAVAATLNLPEPPEPNDVADALAIGLAGLRLQQALRATDAAECAGREVR